MRASLARQCSSAGPRPAKTGSATPGHKTLFAGPPYLTSLHKTQTKPQMNTDKHRCEAHSAHKPPVLQLSSAEIHQKTHLQGARPQIVHDLRFVNRVQRGTGLQLQ